jgi:hypothetical protein
VVLPSIIEGLQGVIAGRFCGTLLWDIIAGRYSGGIAKQYCGMN